MCQQVEAIEYKLLVLHAESSARPIRRDCRGDCDRVHPKSTLLDELPNLETLRTGLDELLARQCVIED